MYKRLWATSKQLDIELLKCEISECGEPMISVFSSKPEQISILNNTGKSLHHVFLRQSVSKAFIRAAAKAQRLGYTMRLFEAYRHLSMQRKKFMDLVTDVTKDNPVIPHAKAKEYANTFVAGIPLLSAHIAGAGVNITLVDTNGKNIDMGCEYLIRGPCAITQYGKLSKQQKTNRMLLLSIMKEAGFTNYPFEYWHYSIGDACAAYLSGESVAKYGPVEYNAETSTSSYPIQGQALYTYFT